jgi:hypothetical protein
LIHRVYIMRNPDKLAALGKEITDGNYKKN